MGSQMRSKGVREFTPSRSPGESQDSPVPTAGRFATVPAASWVRRSPLHSKGRFPFVHG